MSHCLHFIIRRNIVVTADDPTAAANCYTGAQGFVFAPQIQIKLVGLGRAGHDLISDTTTAANINVKLPKVPKNNSPEYTLTILNI